jgi:hypothetical protein
MQTLGLSSNDRRSDGRLKSIFWPTVENAWDVNYLGQQGFWICLVIGVLQLVGIAIIGTPLFLILGAVSFLIFFLGGVGVREGSWPAAAMVFTMFVAGIVDTMSRGMPPGIIAVAAAAVLLSNVRAAFLASEWRPAGPDEDRPTRFNETFSDKLVDQMPAKLWPVLKVPFFIIASLYLLLIFAGFTIQIVHHFGTNLNI